MRYPEQECRIKTDRTSSTNPFSVFYPGPFLSPVALISERR